MCVPLSVCSRPVTPAGTALPSFRLRGAVLPVAVPCGDLSVYLFGQGFADGKKGDMAQRPAGELLDQAICAVQSGSYHVRNAAMLAIRKYMQHSEEHAFQVCRLVEGMENSEKEAEQMLYAMVKDEIND